jgi:hypothetical protein
VVFVFASINVLYYIYRFAYVDLFLHPWDEADLVMVNDLSVMFLDSVCHYFIEVFVSMFIKEISLFSGCVLVQFWDECNNALQNELDSVPFFSILWKSLRSVNISSSLKVW